jgi:hypothetical protein
VEFGVKRVNVCEDIACEFGIRALNKRGENSHCMCQFSDLVLFEAGLYLLEERLAGGSWNVILQL